MLTDVDFEALRAQKESAELRDYLKGQVERRAQGVYEVSSHNTIDPFYKEAILSAFPGHAARQEYYQRTGKFDFVETLPDYGVADTYQQVVEKYPQLVESDRKYLLWFVTLLKEHETPGGWRWEKWGEYIGTQNSEAEYLHDEPEIEQIILWHVCEVK